MSDNVVVCDSDPDIAVIVTVDVPVGVVFVFEPVLDPPHPAMEIRIINSDSVPPAIDMNLRNFFRLRNAGMIAARPSGSTAPAASD